MSTELRRAAIVGSPVGHSLSPVLHSAGYRALGLGGWSYSRLECDADGLPALLAGLDEQWRGLSVTMPAKRAALAAATSVTGRAAAVGAANTLVPLDDGGWRADCTDVDGVTGALRAAGGFVPGDGPGVVLGAGGTAAATLAAFAELAVDRAVLVVREPARAAETVATGERVGVPVEVLRWSEVDFAELAERARVLVSTVPSAAIAAELDALTLARCVLDVVYHPWPTPLAEALQRKGKPVANGLDMLLHQAFDQFEQHTGHPAPREAMRDALREAAGGTIPLPLDPLPSKATMTDAEIEQVFVDGTPTLNSTVYIAEYDPAWPELYQREERRIRAALGERVHSLEHTGSTSVPGLAAKPVIDIMLVVADPADESSYLPELEAAGYRLVVREPDWYQHRALKGPDTDVNLHVHGPDSPEPWRQRMFRDRLRASEADRALYERTKRELAGRVWKYRQHYADAKSEVITEIMRRA